MSKQATQELRDWLAVKVKELLVPAAKLIRDGETHIPMLMIYSLNDELAIVPLLEFDSVIAKDEAMYLHRHLAASNDLVKAAIMLTEAWQVKGDVKNDLGKVDMTKSLEHHPGRTECMMFNCLSQDMQLLAMVEIDRTDKGKLFGEPVFIDPMAPGSPMIGRMVVGPTDKQ